MCLAFFEGKGYSDDFSNHMGFILNEMQSNPLLRIVAEKDVICEKCPNLCDGICKTPDLVHQYDRDVLALCELSENSEISWDEFSQLIKDKILSEGKRENICGNCQWNELCKSKEQLYRS